MEYLKLLQIISFSLIAAMLSFAIAPTLISFLESLKLEKQIRDIASLGGGKAKEFRKLHKHKKGTPTMGAILILIVVAIMVIISILLVRFGSYI